LKENGKKRNELDPNVEISKRGKRIVLKDKALVEIPYPKTKYKRIPKRITLGGT
jgi:hypothetical protein